VQSVDLAGTFLTLCILRLFLISVEECVVMLDENWRMNATLCEFPSLSIYRFFRFCLFVCLFVSLFSFSYMICY
jgi:hypothetical protein